MDCFKIRWRNSAYADLEKIHPRAIAAIVKRVEALAEDPFPAPPHSIRLKGRDNQRRLRVGEYRVLYEVDTENRIVWIAAVGPRGSIYH
jgi:mRNA interferase RelE/StbE